MVCDSRFKSLVRIDSPVRFSVAGPFAIRLRICKTRTQVTDTGLAHLKGLTNLNWLGLRGTQVADAGLAHLKGLTKLTTLDLGHTRVTDARLAHLKELTGLSRLYLDGTDVTDAGVIKLKRALPLPDDRPLSC